MKAFVVYESMFGNTHEVASAIAEGMRESIDTEVLRADQLSSRQDKADILVVGGPTHAHSMSSERTRTSAKEQVDFREELDRESPSETPGIREELDDLAAVAPRFVAFDTRTDMPRILTGAASARISRELRKRGSREILTPSSFLVHSYSGLQPGERERARVWGAEIAWALTNDLSGVH